MPSHRGARRLENMLAGTLTTCGAYGYTSTLGGRPDAVALVEDTAGLPAPRGAALFHGLERSEDGASAPGEQRAGGSASAAGPAVAREDQGAKLAELVQLASGLSPGELEEVEQQFAAELGMSVAELDELLRQATAKPEAGGGSDTGGQEEAGGSAADVSETTQRGLELSLHWFDFWAAQPPTFRTGASIMQLYTGVVRNVRIGVLDLLRVHVEGMRRAHAGGIKTICNCLTLDH